MTKEELQEWTAQLEQARKDARKEADVWREDILKRLDSIAAGRKDVFDGGITPGGEFVALPKVQEVLRSGQTCKFRHEVKTITNAVVPAPPAFGGFTGFVHAPLGMRSVLPQMPVSSPSVEFLRAANKSVVGGIVQTSEGAVKAVATWEYSPVTVPIVTFAELTKISVQADSDFPALRNAIDGELTAQVSETEENEILVGPGGSGRMVGFLHASLGAPVFGGGVSGDTQVDVITRAIAQLAGNGYRTTAVVLPVGGALDISLKKDTLGRLLYPNAAALPWQAQTVVSSKMPTGKFLIGDFTNYSQLLTRSDAIELGLDADDFSRNLISLRYDRRSGLAIRRVEAFLQGSLTPPTL